MWGIDVPWPAGITYADKVWDTNLNQNLPGITSVGAVASIGGQKYEALSGNLSQVDKDRIRKAVDDVVAAVDFPTFGGGPGADFGFGFSEWGGELKANIPIDPIGKKSASFEIFFVDQGQHTIQFSASHFATATKEAKSLLPMQVTVREDVSPVVIQEDLILLEKTFPDGAYVAPSFEGRLIDQSTAVDDCTPSDEMTITTDLFSHLNSQGRLPPGKTLVNLFTEDRWGNEGTGAVEVLVVDTIPPDIHPMDPLGVVVPESTTKILGSEILLQEPFTFDLGSFNPRATCYVGSQSCASYEFKASANTDVIWKVRDTVDNENSVVQEIRVRIEGENNSPTGIPREINIAKGVPTEIVIAAKDADFDKLKFQIWDAPELGGLEVDDVAVFQNRYVSEGNINDFSSFEVAIKKGVSKLSDFVTFVTQSEHNRILAYNNRIGLIDIIESEEIGFNVDEIVTSPRQGTYSNAVDFWTVGWDDHKIKNVFYCHDYGPSEQWPCKESQIFGMQEITLPSSLGVSDAHSMTTDGELFYFLGNSGGKLQIVKVNPATVSSLENIDTGFDYSENTYLTFCGVQCGGASFLLANWDDRNIKKLSVTNGKVVKTWNNFTFDKEEKGDQQSITTVTYNVFEPEAEGVEPILIDPAGIKVDPTADNLSIYIGDSRKSNIVVIQLESNDEVNEGELSSDDNFGMKFVEINALETDYNYDILLADNRGLTKFAYGGTLLAQSTEDGKPTDIPIIDVVAAPDFSVFTTGLDSKFSNSNQITELVQKTLKRNPSPVELENYVSKLNSGSSLDQIRQEIQRTFEFKTLAGGMLEEVYLKYYGEQMAENVKVNTDFTKQQWIDSMTGVDHALSIEDRENYLKNYDAAGKYFVKQLFLEFIDRDPPISEINHWVNHWKNNNRDRDKVTWDMRHTEEAQLYATPRLISLYEDLLDQNPSSGDAWFYFIESVQNADGRMELFGVGEGGAVFHKAQTSPNGPWSDWEWIKKGNVKELALGQNSDGSWTVFAVDKNNSLRSFSSSTGKIVLHSGSQDVSVSPVIVNGHFEWGPSPQHFTTMNAGSNALSGWKINSGSVDYVVNWQAAHGGRSLDMAGSQDGSISQSFATESGSEYQVTFYLAGNPEGGETIKTLEVSAANDSETFTFDTTGKSMSNMGWEKKTFDFTATSGTTTLTFTSIGGGAFGATLDDVSVVQINPTSFAQLVNPDGPWPSPIIDAKHITNNRDSQMPGAVTYRTTFEMPQQFSDASIGIQFNADDAAIVNLNGVDIGSAVALGGDPRGITNTDTTLFEPGTNTLDFVVHNYGGGPNPAWLNYVAFVTFTEPDQEFTEWNQISDWNKHSGWIKDIEVLTNDDGSLEVYGVGSNRAIYLHSQDSNGNWIEQNVAKCCICCKVLYY